MSWQLLGAVAPDCLVDARLQLHHAAQVVASAGVTFLEAESDDSHPNFGWVDSCAALVGRVLPGANVQVALRPADLSLLVLDASGRPSDELTLDGATLEDAYDWLEAVTTSAGARLPAGGMTRASYEIPDHATGRGAAFSLAPQRAFAELACWFANGHHALVELAKRLPNASEVRCWMIVLRAVRRQNPETLPVRPTAPVSAAVRTRSRHASLGRPPKPPLTPIAPYIWSVTTSSPRRPYSPGCIAAGTKTGNWLKVKSQCLRQ